MKIASVITGLSVVILLILLFTGVISFDFSINEIIKDGNRAYAAKNYQQALEIYQKGLNKDSGDPKLNYNLGQASYQLGKFDEAIKYYANADNSVDKYINSGNSSLKLAEAAEDPIQKQQLYQQALETYKEGILAHPQNVPLKYNYEYVKSKLNEMEEQNNQQQNNQDNNENQENNEEQNDNRDEQNDNSQQNQQNEDSEENSEMENSEEKNSEENQSSQDKEGTEQDNSQEEKENQEQNSLQENESDSPDSEQDDINIAQILRMLEKQEQDSLKNNQEVKRSTKEDEYDW